MTPLLHTYSTPSAPAELGAADIIIAGGGIAGVVAAGELSRCGHEVLLLESRSALLHEIVRAQLPADPLFSRVKESAFLHALAKTLRELAPRQTNPASPFSLELASEEQLVQQGVRLLYLAFPAGWKSQPTEDTLDILVGVRGGSAVVKAHRAVIDCTDRAVLLRAAGAASESVEVHTVRQIMRLVEVEQTAPVELDVTTSRGPCHLSIPTADAQRRVLVEVRFELEHPSAQAVEFQLAAVIGELLEAIRAHAPAYAQAALAYLGDEPYLPPDFRIRSGDASASGVVQLRGRPIFGGGLWSHSATAQSLVSDVETLAATGLALAESAHRFLSTTETAIRPTLTQRV